MDSDEVLIRHLRRGAREQSSLDKQAWLQLEQMARSIPDEQTVDAEISVPDTVEAEKGPPLPAPFGAYLLLEQLGQGGMGIVFKARQETLKRLVAVKLVRAGVFANANERIRFQREGEVIARVRHASVVQIFEFGELHGQLYFSMELLEGGTLAHRLKGKPMPPREAAELVRTLAQAVEAAHRQGVVHRDLKPGNVLFAADGTAKITDFGLAKVLDEDSNETMSDAILGTAAYMAPEQARGDSRTVSPVADVYALGVILYEALTGHPPFHGGTRYEILDMVRSRQPESPSGCCRGLSRDLEAICLKCLEKEPPRRYASAAALVDDLDRWLEGRATSARPLHWYNHFFRVARRHAAVVTALGGLFLFLFLVGAFLHFRDPQRKLDDLQRRFRRGETVTLIGESGDPAWSQWGLQQGTVNRSRLEDETFRFSAYEPTVLLLLRDPQRSYRLSAEVRHEDSTRMGEVGLAFGYSQHAAPWGLRHCFCKLTFNDWEARHSDANGKQTLSCIRLGVHLASESNPKFGGVGQVYVAYFTPAALATPGQKPWRSLAVEVRPQGIDLFWESQWLAHVSQPDILERFDKTKLIKVGNRMEDASPDLHPAFTPGDALGLFVGHGRAAFRRVQIEPLPEP